MVVMVWNVWRTVTRPAANIDVVIPPPAAQPA
jgi:hypothetical protein